MGTSESPWNSVLLPSGWSLKYLLQGLPWR